MARCRTLASIALALLLVSFSRGEVLFGLNATTESRSWIVGIDGKLNETDHEALVSSLALDSGAVVFQWRSKDVVISQLEFPSPVSLDALYNSNSEKRSFNGNISKNLHWIQPNNDVDRNGIWDWFVPEPTARSLSWGLDRIDQPVLSSFNVSNSFIYSISFF
jgi:hypothetical protein